MSNPVKIALVTGGSRGLGKNTALKLAEHGNDVILTYRSSRPEAEDVVRQIERLGRRAATLPLNVELSATCGLCRQAARSAESLAARSV
jgi:NAD(P)-dependent dehydrogenase (short-subunit alcohol dehydrogenase family)